MNAEPGTNHSTNPTNRNGNSTVVNLSTYSAYMPVNLFCTYAIYPLDPQKKSAVTVRSLHVVQSADPHFIGSRHKAMPMVTFDPNKSNFSLYQKRSVALK